MSHLDSKSSEFSLSILLKPWYNCRSTENQNYCCEIMKLPTDTFGQILITCFCLGITDASNNMFSKEDLVTLWGILRNSKTKFVTETLEDPCLKSPEPGLNSLNPPEQQLRGWDKSPSCMATTLPQFLVHYLKNLE